MRFSETSFWIESVEPGRHPALFEPVQADVVASGGDFTGLSAAIDLRQRGLSVVLLERATVGLGASGRNCGQVGADIGKNLSSLKRYLGEARAGQTVGTLRAATEALDQRIEQEKIDCDYRRAWTRHARFWKICV